MLFLGETKILSYNIVSLNAILKKGNLQPLLAEENPDIFFLQETKTHDLNKPAVAEFHARTAVDYPYFGYSFGEFGVCFYSKIKPLTWQTLSPFGQGRVVTVTFPDVFIINVYAMNASLELKNLKKKLAWTKWLSGLIRSGPLQPNLIVSNTSVLSSGSTAMQTPVLLCGDLNVVREDIDIWVTNLSRPASLKKKYQKLPGFSPVEQKDFEALISAHRFIDLFRAQSQAREYTYYGYQHNENALFFEGKQNHGWRLDYFLYNGIALNEISLRNRLPSTNEFPPLDNVSSNNIPSNENPLAENKKKSIKKLQSSIDENPPSKFTVQHKKYFGSDHLPIILIYKSPKVFNQVLNTVRVKITPWGRIYRQTGQSKIAPESQNKWSQTVSNNRESVNNKSIINNKNSITNSKTINSENPINNKAPIVSEKPMYRLFEYADFQRHHIYITLQTLVTNYQFTSFSCIDTFKRFYRQLSPKNAYEIIRGRCKIYFDLDNCDNPRPFIKKIMTYFDLNIGQVFIKKSNKGYHIICDKWISSNSELKEIVMDPGNSAIFTSCDNKVYTKNRFMRMLYSSKFGQNDPFIPVDFNDNVLENVKLEDYMIQML